jgi:recombination protein RecA
MAFSKQAPKGLYRIVGTVENMITNKYKVGGMASLQADRAIYIIDSGILSLNLAVGTNGLLGGRMSMIWGDTACGKTMIYLCMIAQTQRNGGRCAFIDVEGTFDIQFARMLGVDTDALFLVSAQEKRLNDKGERLPPLSGEQLYDIINLLIYSGQYHLIVTDSITAMVPQLVLQKETITQDAQKGALAQLHSSQLRKTNAYLLTAPHCHYGMISQSRTKPEIGQGQQTKKEGGKYSAGGNAANFYVSYEMYAEVHRHVRERLPIAEGSSIMIEQDVGVDVSVMLEKLKVGRVKEPAEFYVDLRTGVCQPTDVVRTARKLGLISQSSSWFKFGEHKWNGEDAAIQALRENEETLVEVREACIKTLDWKFTDLSQEVEAPALEVAEPGTEEFQQQVVEQQERDKKFVPRALTE